ncbi:MAG: hypothetical protein ACE5G5_02450 [Candidatus Methylomirabilales bacterium]
MKLRRIVIALLIGMHLGWPSATLSSPTGEIPFDPNGKQLVFASFLPLVTDAGVLVPVLVEFYEASTGEVVVEWNPFQDRRLQAVDFSPDDPCGPVWINKALLTKDPGGGWVGWILRSEPIDGDMWELEPSVSPQCNKSRERLTT